MENTFFKYTKSETINLARKYNLSDTSIDILTTIRRFGPLPRRMLRSFYNKSAKSSFSHSLNALTRTGGVYVKNGCVGALTQNLPAIDVENNMTTIKLFSVLSDLNEQSHITFFDYGNYSNEIFFTSRNKNGEDNYFKAIYIPYGEEDDICSRYSQISKNEVDDNDKTSIKYICIVDSVEQIKKINFPGIRIFARLDYVPNNWSIDWKRA